METCRNREYWCVGKRDPRNECTIYCRSREIVRLYRMRRKGYHESVIGLVKWRSRYNTCMYVLLCLYNYIYFLLCESGVGATGSSFCAATTPCIPPQLEVLLSPGKLFQEPGQIALYPLLQAVRRMLSIPLNVFACHKRFGTVQVPSSAIDHVMKVPLDHSGRHSGGLHLDRKTHV